MKIIFCLLLLVLFINISAQNYDIGLKTEIKTYVEEFNKLVEKGSYYEALQEIEYIKTNAMMLYGLFLDEKMCPTELGGYKLNLDTRSNEIKGDKITFIREYMKMNLDSTFNEDIMVRLIISNEDPVIEKIASLNAFTFSVIDEDLRKFIPITVKENKAILVFDKETKFSSIAVALSDVLTVKIDVFGKEDYTLVTEIANQINYSPILQFMP